ncbi:hypothetical protein P7K49_027879, partial [Saguinus oedipus]
PEASWTPSPRRVPAVFPRPAGRGLGGERAREAPGVRNAVSASRLSAPLCPGQARVGAPPAACVRADAGTPPPHFLA